MAKKSAGGESLSIRGATESPKRRPLPEPCPGKLVRPKVPGFQLPAGRYGPRLMSWQWVVWIYVALLVVGGLLGFLKAGSKFSLISSVAFAIPLVAVTFGYLPPIVAKVIPGFVAVVMGVRWAKTKKFMPAGMTLIVSVLTLAVLLTMKGL
jgi:uncharacterized membrane protein (UPF0136 family)